MASFGHQTYTINGKTVYLKWIKTNHKDIRIASANGYNIYDYCKKNNSYGINGTFFCTSTGTPAGYNYYDVHKIAMTNANPGVTNVSAVRNYGATNVAENGACVLFCQNHMTAEIPYMVYSANHSGNLSNFTYQGHDLDMKNILWAIGGFNLCLNQSFASDSAYNAQVPSYLHGNHPRTAMFYIGGSSAGENMVLLTVFNDANMYTSDNSSNTGLLSSNSGGITPAELRTIIKTVFPAATTHGILLDGGASTGIVYKGVSGNRFSQMVKEHGVNSPRIANNLVLTTM